MRVFFVMGFLFKNVLFDFMGIEHVFLFFLYFVTIIDGLVHDPDDVFVVIVDELFLGPVCITQSVLLRCLGLLLI